MPAYPPPAARPERSHLATTTVCAAPRCERDGCALGTGKARVRGAPTGSAVTVGAALKVPAGAR